MECPVCNGMAQLRRECSQCADGTTMEDLGPASDYYGPYSPYQEEGDELTADTADEKCVHVCRCPACGRKDTVSLRG